MAEPAPGRDPPAMPPDPNQATGRRSEVSRRRLVFALTLMATEAGAFVPSANLATAAITVGGDWAGSLTSSARTVLERMRAACLAGVPLLSPRQPARIQVDNHREGPPHVWLHFDDEPVADIVVDVTERDWSRLAYQFGHELGHVLANSWRRDALPGTGSRWLEEALVETFSLRGSELLAQGWERDPPWPGDAPFGAAIRRYKDNQLRVYAGYAAAQGELADPRHWFRSRRAALEESGGLSEGCEALIPFLLAELSEDPARVGEIGALNLWPERTALPLPAYLDAWERSCAALGAAGWMPRRIREAVLGG